jgi:hypothetical protein
MYFGSLRSRTHLHANFFRFPDRPPEWPSGSPRDAIQTCPYEPFPMTKSRWSRYAGRLCDTSDGWGESAVTAGGGNVGWVESGGVADARGSLAYIFDAVGW